MAQKTAWLTILGILGALALAGCAERLPCVTNVYVKDVPVVHCAVVLPFDDREVMGQPIPKTVGMGYYKRTEKSGPMLREAVQHVLINAVGVSVVPFDDVDKLLAGRLITPDELSNVKDEQPIDIGLRLGAEIVVAGRVGLCGEEDAPKSPKAYLTGEVYIFEAKSGRLLASLQMNALNYPESCAYISHKMCTELGLKLGDAVQAAVEREAQLQRELYKKRNPLPHADRFGTQ